MYEKDEWVVIYIVALEEIAVSNTKVRNRRFPDTSSTLITISIRAALRHFDLLSIALYLENETFLGGSVANNSHPEATCIWLSNLSARNVALIAWRTVTSCLDDCHTVLPSFPTRHLVFNSKNAYQI